jgi:hypothetical protein
MIERGPRPGFLLESGSAGRIAGEFGWQDFQGHVAMKLLIAGPPDFAHASLAEFGKDLVFSESGAGHSDIIAEPPFRALSDQEAN